jgi:hypothetical protein
MANVRESNVIFVDTDAGFAGPLTICSIKYIGNASGTAVVTFGSSGAGGDPLWQDSGTANLPVEEVGVYCPDGFYVDVANGAKLYIYLE